MNASTAYVIALTHPTKIYFSLSLSLTRERVDLPRLVGAKTGEGVRTVGRVPEFGDSRMEKPDFIQSAVRCPHLTAFSENL
ncbi:MAG: hypothetical protein GF315_05465 [candidate division Zixibacteria bacterium]|nr:hypothetical protein [candidate division Zixibacteria bacterium]